MGGIHSNLKEKKYCALVVTNGRIVNVVFVVNVAVVVGGRLFLNVITGMLGCV